MSRNAAIKGYLNTFRTVGLAGATGLAGYTVGNADDNLPKAVIILAFVMLFFAAAHRR